MSLNIRFVAILATILIASLFSSHVSLLAAIIFTFFVPGYVITMLFFRNLSGEEKIFTIPILSVMVSTHVIYYLSLLLGYSKEIILLSFAVFLIPALFVRLEKPRLKMECVMLSMVTFLISFVILYNSVWVEDSKGVIITGSNWQDTPMHYEIIESINNGNFPPEMPYYAGQKMNYHYFVDFHTAILENVHGFCPKLLPATNAVFISLFALAVYIFARELRDTSAGIYASIIAVFGWGFSYYLLIKALIDGTFQPTGYYIYQYGGFFALPPIFDNLLQQRPLLVGLPALTFIAHLLRRSKERDVLLAGLLTGLLFPFHALAFFTSGLIYSINLIKAIISRNVGKQHLYYFLFLFPSIPFIVMSLGNHGVGMKHPWAFEFLKGNPVVFYLANLGIPFILSILALLFRILRENSFFVYSWLFTLFILPNVVSFTPNPWDMYKFFHFAWIPIALTSGVMLAEIQAKLRKVGIAIAIVLLIFSTLSSVSVAMYNVCTSYVAADWNEFDAGMWVRENTEEKAVFLTFPSIHSPPTMIGGRLRVLSYLNWPYGHGIPLDEIWERFEDVKRAYKGDLDEVVKKYNVSYIYVGKEELREFPDCNKKFASIKWLEKVYEKGRITIYRVRK
jgi:uncharacterized membrane protein